MEEATEETIYNIPVAYLMGSIISLKMSVKELREHLRKKPIPSVNAEAPIQELLTQYNSFLRDDLLKEVYEETIQTRSDV